MGNENYEALRLNAPPLRPHHPYLEVPDRGSQSNSGSGALAFAVPGTLKRTHCDGWDARMDGWTDDAANPIPTGCEMGLSGGFLPALTAQYYSTWRRWLMTRAFVANCVDQVRRMRNGIRMVSDLPLCWSTLVNAGQRWCWRRSSHPFGGLEATCPYCMHLGNGKSEKQGRMKNIARRQLHAMQ